MCAFTATAQNTTTGNYISTNTLSASVDTATLANNWGEQCYCCYQFYDKTYCRKPATDCFLFRCILHSFIIMDGMEPGGQIMKPLPLSKPVEK